MSKGEAKKDKLNHTSRRRQIFDSAEDSRTNSSYTSSQSHCYPHHVTGPHPPLNYNPWYRSNYHHPPPNGHHIGAVHIFPAHQIFMQHGPFGNETNHYRPAGYAHQFALQFPHHLDQHHPTFLNEQRRQSFQHQCDNGQLEEMLKNSYEYNGPNNNRERVFKTEQSQGARPKLGLFQNGKKKCFKKKRNQNNSSNLNSQPECEVEREHVSADENKLAGSDHLDPLIKEGHSIGAACGKKTRTCDSFQTVGAVLPCTTGNCRNPTELVRCDQLEMDGLEGAVGGQVMNSSHTTEQLSSRSTSLDKNLIDEGAFCDLDRMFQHQEFSRYNGDHADVYPSDDEGVMPGKFSHRGLGQSSCQDSELYHNGSDDDSELENCSYVYDPKQSHTLGLNSTSPQQTSLKKSLFHKSDKFDNMNGKSCSINTDDIEDTGDFIDTDLPSQKHLLSSSDEMDNSSSISSSDHEDDDRKPSRKNHDYNSNDLSAFECEVQVHTLCIHEDANDIKDPLSSQLNARRVETENQTSGLLSVPQRTADACNSSSESENGENLPHSKPSQFCALNNNIPQGCYSPTGSCLEGAAASQLPAEASEKHLADSYNSCPPGAECELPPVSPPQCFHSNLFCPGVRVSPCGQNKPSQSPAREHVAFTASSEMDHSGDFHHQPLESASCSVTADGGACCPPGFQGSGVNDLNVCCHHSHSHVANGFTVGSPGANFSNDESNRLQKVFVKFSSEDKLDEGESHSASSCDLEDVDGFGMLTRKQDKSNDSGGSEDPLSHDNGDNVDMVLLPMEEEIEPVHHMTSGLCAGGVDEDDDLFESSSQLALSSKHGGNNLGYLYDEHLCAHDQNPLGNGMPSKEFYELIKTVSTTDSYMRFFDKDGLDVQRQPYVPCDDDSKQNSSTGGQNSKAERLKVDRVMIWNEYEAYVMQFKQIAVSACGQTAVLNVLKALKFNCEKSAVCKVIQTSLRKEDACIPEYLFSRAKAGTTAGELMSGVEKLSGGAVGGRFFHFWPPRKVKLLQWLAYWMKRGAIPMATLNLQQGPHSLWQVPDSWHHQMVYGVSHQGLYLTNPLEIVSERSAMKQLCSDSVLMVRRQDIISRFREITDLGQLLNHPDPRWRTMNVLGQVVNVLRESNMPSVPGYRLQVTSHVSIPASYKAGITLFMRKDKSAWKTLLSAPEIPLEP